MTKKVITPASGSAQTIYYETNDDNTVVKFSAGGRTVTSHSGTDSFGRKTFDELQLGTGFVSRQFSYHLGEVTQAHIDAKNLKSSATTQLVSQIILSNDTTLSYTYDAEERITSVVETYTVNDTPVTNTTIYTYDALGQLLTETVNGEVVNSMEYDNYGNITKKNGKDYSYGNATWKDLLTSYNGQTITYDAQGNPLTYLGHTLEWEKGRQLKKFDNIEYTYNANGIRTSKKVNGVLHTYTLDGTKILRETWDGNTLVPLYDNEDSVCGILYNNIPYYFIKNLQGDVIAIVDKDTQTVAKYSYDAWGTVTSAVTYTELTENVDIATINPFRYRGYYYDEEIGMYYLQSRYYDASVGRFVNADIPEIIIGNLLFTSNLFAYCSNCPVNSIDIEGKLGAQLIARIIIGIMLGFLVQLLSDLIALWFRQLFQKSNASFQANPGDYISSMITWALTCVSFNKKSLEMIAALLPLVIKHVGRVFNKSFDWLDLALDLLSTLVSYIIRKVLGNKAKNDLRRIKNKLGTSNQANKLFRIKSNRMNLKVQVWGIKLNLGMNISSFFVSSIYSFVCAKNNW